MHDPTKMTPDENPAPDSAEPSREDSETPFLFDELTEGTPARKDPGSSTPPPRGDGLEGLATRLPGDQAPRWAMNWRPTGEDQAKEIPGEHHPARTAGIVDEEPAETEVVESTTPVASEASAVDPESNDDSHSAESIDEIETDPTETEVVESTTPVASEGSVIDPESNDDSHSAESIEAVPEDMTVRPALVTSRTWEGGNRRHPQPPEKIDDDRIDHRAPADHGRRTGGSGRMGWIAAAVIGLIWVGVEIARPSSTPAAPPAVTADVAPVEPTLARPAPDPERAMMLEEIGILQDELAVLRRELGAAHILRDDHERISTSLQRFERRWTNALDQLQFLESSLQREEEERMAIAAELDRTQRMLDEARSSD
ncbi:MAG: hypothetical protein GY895_02125 [Phycisphaera sp.]|nr:hypothetical protein [Phycisphaera sp.]